MWSEKLIYSSRSFKERGHLLRLKPPSYYCDNLPLSPYTQPFSLGRREGGRGRWDFWVKYDIQRYCTLPLHCRPVWTSIPSWSSGGQAVRKKSAQCHARWMFHRNVWPSVHVEVIYSYEHLSQASPKGFYRRKKRNQKSECNRKRKKVKIWLDVINQKTTLQDLSKGGAYSI